MVAQSSQRAFLRYVIPCLLINVVDAPWCGGVYDQQNHARELDGIGNPQTRTTREKRTLDDCPTLSFLRYTSCIKNISMQQRCWIVAIYLMLRHIIVVDLIGV